MPEIRDGSDDPDGGTAFPVDIKDFNLAGEVTRLQFTGMSLLDWFAGQALAGLSPMIANDSSQAVASIAYDLAASMLIERSNLMAEMRVKATEATT